MTGLEIGASLGLGTGRATGAVVGFATKLIVGLVTGAFVGLVTGYIVVLATGATTDVTGVDGFFTRSSISAQFQTAHQDYLGNTCQD
jgi:hypothetical protein